MRHCLRRIPPERTHQCTLQRSCSASVWLFCFPINNPRLPPVSYDPERSYAQIYYPPQEKFLSHRLFCPSFALPFIYNVLLDTGKLSP